MRYLASRVMVLAALSAPASADDVTVTITEEGGKLVCLAEKPTASPKASVSVNRQTPKATHIEVCDKAGACTPRPLSKDKESVEFGGVDMTQAKVNAISADGKATCEAAPADTETKPGLPAIQPPTRVGLTALDIAAEQWLTEKAGGEALQRIRDGAKRAVLVLHLPSGALASVSPAGAREDARIQFAYLYDRTTVKNVVLAVDKCNELALFRINGESLSLGVAKADTPPPPVFGIAPIGPARECGAGVLEYSLTIGTGDLQRFALPLRPVFTLSTSFVYGFDTGSATTYAVQGKKIAEQKDRRGTAFYAGFTWHAFPDGLDASDHAFRGADPFVAFNLKAPTEDLLVGVKVAARRGVGLALGLSLRKSVVLSGAAVGDAHEAEAPIPTRKEWDRQSLGFFVGVNFDAASVAGVRQVFGAK